MENILEDGREKTTQSSCSSEDEEIEGEGEEGGIIGIKNPNNIEYPPENSQQSRLFDYGEGEEGGLIGIKNPNNIEYPPENGQQSRLFDYGGHHQQQHPLELSTLPPQSSGIGGGGGYPVHSYFSYPFSGAPDFSDGYQHHGPPTFFGTPSLSYGIPYPNGIGQIPGVINENNLSSNSNSISQSHLHTVLF
uniref:Uncharacterized protein n=1 Tax=Panagrolaimus sp. ES5 TaxID=591445 RepID=A0AC34G9G6_9BILA